MIYEYRGEKLTVTELQDRFNKLHNAHINWETMHLRLTRYNYTPEQAVETPKQWSKVKSTTLFGGNGLAACRHRNEDFNHQLQICRICGASRRVTK